MNRDYGITANSKHYTCVIDLLGRAGRLDDALRLMKSMPFEPDAATWGALFGASRIHGNIPNWGKKLLRWFSRWSLVIMPECMFFYQIYKQLQVDGLMLVQ